jgi:hypothetical protein
MTNVIFISKRLSLREAIAFEKEHGFNPLIEGYRPNGTYKNGKPRKTRCYIFVQEILPSKIRQVPRHTIKRLKLQSAR